jgi:hypothetical protein
MAIFTFIVDCHGQGVKPASLGLLEKIALDVSYTMV